MAAINHYSPGRMTLPVLASVGPGVGIALSPGVVEVRHSCGQPEIAAPHRKIHPHSVGAGIIYHAFRATAFIVETPFYPACRSGGGSVCGERSDNAHNGKNQDDASRDLIDQPHRPEVEMSPDLVDKKRHHPPPEQRTGKNEHIADQILIKADLRQQEIEPGEQTDYQKDNQRVGECKKETAEDILAFRHPVDVRFPKRTRRIRAEEIYAEGHEHNTADYLDQILVGLEEILYER